MMPFFAEISLRSPRKLFIFIIKKIMYRVKVSRNNNNSILKTTSLLFTVGAAAPAEATPVKPTSALHTSLQAHSNNLSADALPPTALRPNNASAKASQDLEGPASGSQKLAASDAHAHGAKCLPGVSEQNAATQSASNPTSQQVRPTHGREH